MIAALEAGVPSLVAARTLIEQFQAMIRTKNEVELASWLQSAKDSLVASFAKGVTNDEAAVRAAITSTWSNGQTEGQVTKLKLVKRQMYGPCKNRSAASKVDCESARGLGADRHHRSLISLRRQESLHHADAQHVRSASISTPTGIMNPFYDDRHLSVVAIHTQPRWNGRRAPSISSSESGRIHQPTSRFRPHCH